MDVMTINNHKDFHNRLVDLGFTYVDLSEFGTGWEQEDYFIILRDDGKSRFRLGISIRNDQKTITLTVRKYKIINGRLKSAGHFVTIEQEIPFDKIVELKQAYS